MKNKIYLFSFILLSSSQISLAIGNLSLVADDSRISNNSIIDTQKPKITSTMKASLEGKESTVESKTNLFTFKTEYQEKPVFDWRQNQIGLNNNNSIWGASLESKLLNDSVKVNGELKSGNFRAYEVGYSEDSHKFDQNLYSYNNSANNQIDYDNKLINLALDGKSSLINYGIKYQSMGLNYNSFLKTTDKTLKKDKEGFNYWIDKDIDKLNLKLNYSDMWNNVKLDPNKPRYNEKLIGLSSTYAISTWPYSSLTLSYRFGDRQSTYVPQKMKSYSGRVNEVSALFNISYDNFDVSVGSTLGNRKNNIDALDKSRSISHFLSASYSPISSLYITPNISYSTDFFENAYSAYKYTSVDQSVSVYYKPENSAISAFYYISHTSYKGTDGSVDYATLNNQFSIQWKIHSNKKKASILSLNMIQARNKDNIYSTSSYNDMFVGVGWTASFD